MEENKKPNEFLRAVKFTLISISAGIIQLGSFALLDGLIFSDKFYWISYLISLLLSIIWNFTINRRYTFQSANNVKIAMLLVLAFYAVFTPVSLLLGQFAVNYGWNTMLVEVLTMLLNFILEFLYSRFIVYRNACDTIKKD